MSLELEWAQTRPPEQIQPDKYDREILQLFGSRQIAQKNTMGVATPIPMGEVGKFVA